MGAGLGVALLAVVACSRSPDVATEPKPPAVGVVAAAPHRVPVYGEYVGQAEAV